MKSQTTGIIEFSDLRFVHTELSVVGSKEIVLEVNADKTKYMVMS